MQHSPSVLALSSALVHARVRVDGPEHVRHERFIREKLFLLSLVLAALPLGLAFYGLPSPAEAVLFASALMPLACALIVVRTGRLAAAQVVAVGGEVAIAVLLATSAGIAAAMTWLILAIVEAAAVRPNQLRRLAGLLLFPAAAAIVLLGGIAAAPRSTTASTLAALCALAAAAPVAWRLVSAQRAEPAWAGRSARDAALVAALGDAVVVFDLSGAMIEVSDGLGALPVTELNELMGRAFFEHVNVADRPAFLKLLGDAVHEGGTMRGTLRLRTAAPAGHAKPRHVTIELRAHAAGREIVAILRDVTETRRREAEVDTAQRSVEEVLRSKDHFLANMSHELRTPLNAIIGFSEMLGSRTMSPTDPAKQREYAGIIHQAGQHLLAVVNSILDMSKIQSGTLTLIPEPFSLSPFLEQCCDVVRLQAQQRRVEIVRDVPDDLEELVADRRACHQILSNLLSNAVKFTSEGGRVTLRVRPEGTGLRIAVSDTGIGIAEADLSRLGKPFFQAGATLSRHYEGTGLGLSVVRGLVGLHGGTIVVESEPGKGTSVTVRLPLDCRHVPATASAAIETIPRRSAIDTIRPFERSASDTRMKQSA